MTAIDKMTEVFDRLHAGERVTIQTEETRIKLSAPYLRGPDVVWRYSAVHLDTGQLSYLHGIGVRNMLIDPEYRVIDSTEVGT